MGISKPLQGLHMELLTLDTETVIVERSGTVVSWDNRYNCNITTTATNLGMAMENKYTNIMRVTVLLLTSRCELSAINPIRDIKEKYSNFTLHENE